LLSGLSGRRVYRDDDIHIETDKLVSESTETIKLTPCVSIFDADVLAFNAPEISETQPERLYLS
jgi:hypothetical protein